MRGFMEKNSPSLYSNNIVLSKRIFSFEVKIAKNGSKYLSITVNDPKMGQSRILIFESNIRKFVEELNKALNALIS
jgi:hypothetical protein